MKSLDQLRLEINEIDEKLLPLIIKRMELSKEIAMVKEQTGVPTFDDRREAAILERVKYKAGAYSEEAAELYEEIMRYSKKYQDRIREERRG